MSSGDKYLRRIIGKDGTAVVVDVYAVIDAFDVKCPARQHAIKKIACTGIRGKGDALQDLREARDAVDRAIELEEHRIKHRGKESGDRFGLREFVETMERKVDMTDVEKKLLQTHSVKLGPLPKEDLEKVKLAIETGTAKVSAVCISCVSPCGAKAESVSGESLGGLVRDTVQQLTVEQAMEQIRYESKHGPQRENWGKVLAQPLVSMDPVIHSSDIGKE